MMKIKMVLALFLLVGTLIAWSPPIRCADGRPPVLTGGGIMICPFGWDTNR